MQRTENYRLFKPESTDNGSPEPFNNNADVVDAELNRLSTGLSRVDNALVVAQDVLESGITAAKVSKLDALPTSEQLDGSLSSKANKSDITNISITGTTNNTGSNILSGTLFYLNGSLCEALTGIASGATFTNGTNYAETTINGNLTNLMQSGTATLSYASANYLQSQHIPLKRKGMKIVASLNSQIGSTEPFQIIASVDDTGEPFGTVLIYSPNGVITRETTKTVNWIAI